jgi:hypothetical protein
MIPHPSDEDFGLSFSLITTTDVSGTTNVLNTSDTTKA